MNQKQVTFYFEGDDYFHDLWEDLNGAEHTIFIEVYIIDPDAIGLKLKEILIHKALQGVNVKLMYDALGSRSLPDEYKKDLTDAGVAVRVFHRFNFLKPILSKINKRDHRKLIIIDSKIAYMGGMNLSQHPSRRYMGEKRWRDTQVRLVGQLVDKLVYHFKRSFRILRFRSKRLERMNAANDILATRNHFGKNQIRKFIHRYIRQSHHKIQITTAYFVPDLETLFLLARAKKRGVHVQILTNGEANDVPLINRINRPLLKYLLKRGVEVFFFKGRMLHAKSLVFDHRVATVGSSNLNYRSFFRDREINFFFRQESWIKKIEDQFEQDLKESRPVSLHELKDISWMDKIKDWVFYLIRSFF